MLRRVNLAGSTSYDEVIARVKAWAKDVTAGRMDTRQGLGSEPVAEQGIPNPRRAVARFSEQPGRARPRRRTRYPRQREGDGARSCHRLQPRIPRVGVSSGCSGGAPSGVFIDNAQSSDRERDPGSEPGGASQGDPRGNRRMQSARDSPECTTPAWSRDTIGIYEELAKAGNFNLRNYVMLSDPGESSSPRARGNPYLRRGPQSALYDGHLWIRAIKLYADGALGSRGAALLAPYADEPANSGLLVSRPEHIRRLGRRGAAERIPGERPRDRRSRQSNRCSTHSSPHSSRFRRRTIVSASSTPRW